MKILIYDSVPDGHQVELPESAGNIVNDPAFLACIPPDLDAVMIHTGERPPAGIESAIMQVLESTALPVVIYSGGGLAEPRRLAALLQPPGAQRLWAYAAPDAARRLRRAVSESRIARLFDPDRLDVALEALNALWIIHLKMECGCVVQRTDLAKAEGEYLKVERFGEPLPTDPFQPGKPLTTVALSAIIRHLGSKDTFKTQLEAIRDSLIAWSEP